MNEFVQLLVLYYTIGSQTVWDSYYFGSVIKFGHVAPPPILYSPVLVIISNIAGLFLIVLSYSIIVTRKFAVA